MFLAYTIWQLQIDVSILYNMLIELEELILDTSEDMGDVLDNGWNA